MVNIRWGLTAGAVAFLVSIGLGIISGVNVSYIFLRAFLFAFVFFAFGFAARYIINNFFPELLFEGNESERQGIHEQPGSRINITLDSAGEYAVPELYKAPGDPQELGNIEDLVSGYFKPRSEESVDRKQEEGYNINSNVKDDLFDEKIDFEDAIVFEKPKADKPVFTPSFGDDSEGLGGLPDLDALAMAFSSKGEPDRSNDAFSDPMPFELEEDTGYSGSADFFSPVNEEFEPAESHYVGNKPQPLKGDFNPKELAEGIRTVLSKDK